MSKTKANEAVESSLTPNRYIPVKVDGDEVRLRKRWASTRPWWANKAVIVVLTVAFSSTDAVVLFSLFDHCFVEDPKVGWVSALCTAVLLNVIPVFGVTLAKRHVYRTKRMSKQWCIALVIGFTLIFAGSVFLRLSNMAMFEAPELEAYGTAAVAEITAEEESSIGLLSGVTMLCLLPAATSLVNGALCWFAPCEVETEMMALEEEILQLKQKATETRAALATMPGDAEFEFRLSLEEVEYQQAVSIVNARIERLRAVAAQVLMEQLGTPSDTTFINEKGLERLRQADITSRQVSIPTVSAPVVKSAPAIA